MQGPNISLWVDRGLEAILGQVSGSHWAYPGLSVWSQHRVNVYRGPVVLAALGVQVKKGKDVQAERQHR